jgi:hypothetical protein
MSRIVRLTERDLSNIVKRTIMEMESSNEFTTLLASPAKVSVIRFNKPMDYNEVESIMKKYGSTYRFPINWDSVKGTFNGGEYWSGDKNGTYNIGYYDMKDKEKYNGHRNDKKYLMLVKI